MLYFDLAIYKEDLLKENEKNLPSFIKNIIYNFRKLTGQALNLKISNKNLIILPKINKRVLKRIDKILRVDVTKNVCISDELKIKENFVNFLNERNINILDGRWLFKYLVENVLEFLCVKTDLIPEIQEISILTNELNNLIYETIIKLSKRVKNINIITKNINLFKKLEEDVYEESGMILRITNDFKKATLKSNIILNFNFVQELLDKINFGKNSNLVNFEKSLRINQKSFNGKVINFYHINLPEKYLYNQERFTRFDTSILYESYIYKKTSPINIWKEISKDKIKIPSRCSLIVSMTKSPPNISTIIPPIRIIAIKHDNSLSRMIEIIE